MMVRSRKIPVDKIVLVDELYPRSHTDYRTVANYTEAMLQGANFPPLSVAEEDGIYFLIDGWHRLAAFKKAGAKTVPCVVLQIERKQWAIEAFSLNAKHGRPFTLKEKIDGILRLRRMGYEDGEIGDCIGLTQTYITSLLETKAIVSPSGKSGISLKPAMAEVMQTVVKKKGEINIEAIQKAMSGQKQFSMINQVLGLLQNGLINHDDDRVIQGLVELHTLTTNIYEKYGCLEAEVL